MGTHLEGIARNLGSPPLCKGENSEAVGEARVNRSLSEGWWMAYESEVLMKLGNHI